MFVPDEIVEEIRSRVDIVDVISPYVRLQKKGSNFFGLCPFHNEKSPSFSVSQSRQMFHCFGCGVSGNVFTFLMKYENYTFPEVLETLAERTGVTLPKQDYSEEAKKRESKKEKLLAANKDAATWYYHVLRSPQGEKGLEYFKKRQLTEETMNRFGLGFAPASGGLSNYLKNKGYEDEILIEAGLSSFDERYGLRDKFWNRVIFPILDKNSRVIGFGGRVLGTAEPKYLNTQETLIFDKGRNLYALNLVRSSRENYCILCEGYMDVIAMHQAGFSMATTSLGTAFTEAQARLISRYAKEVILAYDSDEPGIKAAIRASSILRNTDLSCRVLSLAPHKDPDEFIKNEGREEFEKRIKEAENSFLFEIRMLERNYRMDDPDEKSRFHRKIAESLLTFEEEDERENYLEVIAEKYRIGPDALRSLLKSEAARKGDIPVAVRPKTTEKKKTPDNGEKRTQQIFLTYLIERPAFYRQVKKYVSPADFTESIYQKAAEQIFLSLDKGEPDPAAVIGMFTDEEEQTAVAALFNARLPDGVSEKDHAKAFHDSLCELKRISYEHFASAPGDDAGSITEVIERKKQLDEIVKLPISAE